MEGPTPVDINKVAYSGQPIQPMLAELVFHRLLTQHTQPYPFSLLQSVILFTLCFQGPVFHV